MKIAANVLSALIFSAATLVHADASFSKNESYQPGQVSADIQGFGNQVLDQAGKSKYLKFDLQGAEYAYTIERMGSNDVQYTGNAKDLNGVIFINVRAFKDGFELPKQVSTFKPSKYNNAIRIVKMDRNDERPYEFDLGMDEDKRLFLIDGPTSTTHLEQVDTIKKYVSRKDKKSPYAF
ncbi:MULTISPECIES: hypothetical protein [Pseudomonas]|uniref:Uncharacterized protein n=1 Tax=Pseudomonas synxantha TaxID=47883 RepID=A0AAX3IEJ5_9PSED|nr:MULTISPECIES: hypothetical protein [Pseudomonas]PRW70398.1 hypothetical protein C7A09_03325 [Pseudomonas fluorescens]KRP57698.1 hypothetical protein TU77_02870 [Pseudomonas synxantha]MBA6042179.1 hypothetical protein [Pseudomonas lactis]SDU56708.1 hypothetical protein SAMN05216475_4730 [Pseudomonas synxantha]VTR04729.1 Uncharacterised protein [Pseudomonas synxantha]